VAIWPQIYTFLMDDFLTGEILWRPYFENDPNPKRKTVLYRDSEFYSILADMGIQSSFQVQQVTTICLGFRWRQIPRVTYFASVIVDDTSRTVTNCTPIGIKPIVNLLLSMICEDLFGVWEQLSRYFLLHQRVHLEPSLFNFFVKIRGYRNGEMQNITLCA
jgi:hypothetical protein